MMWSPRHTLDDSLSDVKAYALAGTMADTLPKAKAKTIWPVTTQCKGQGTAQHIACKSCADGGQDSCDKLGDVMG